MLYRGVMKRVRVLLSSSLLLFLIGGAMLTANMAQASAAPHDPVLASMRLVDPAGQPMSGVRVRAAIMPQGRFRATWGKRPYPQAGIGQTDANGHILMSLLTQPAPGDATFRSALDTANYQLYLLGPRGPIPFFTFPRFVGTATANAAVSTSARFSSFNNPASATSGVIRLSSGAYAQYKPMQRLAPQAVGFPCDFGYWNEVSIQDDWAVIGDLHSQPWTSVASFTYGSTADSTIGVLSSYDGTNFSASGEAHIANSASAQSTLNEGGATFAYHVKGFFQFGKYNWVACDVPTDNYEIDPDFWTGGLTWGDSISFTDERPNQYTLQLKPGQQFRTTNETAYHYGVGANVFGWGVDTQSGFSSSVVFFISAQSTTHGYIYGSNTWPASATEVYVSDYCPSIQLSCQ